MGYPVSHKPMAITTAKNLLWLMKVMHEAIVLNSPKTLSEAKLMISNFEVITSEAIIEAEDALAPAAVAA
jgi:hypothetical protein